eukprot:CAMPEP_0196805790 /NCGR_PEP_ID=MMETSP1362-20130617/5610_1 /TAXON_ID=163516 /ORGANISM="Leptocylindrus danicus, Strain CCMP1856" /LENGTH=44 /DNA_ID= /DNA_START= /DNA_END= /DNA_ORIENTATION=
MPKGPDLNHVAPVAAADKLDDTSSMSESEASTNAAEPPALYVDD